MPIDGIDPNENQAPPRANRGGRPPPNIRQRETAAQNTPNTAMTQEETDEIVSYLQKALKNNQSRQPTTGGQTGGTGTPSPEVNQIMMQMQDENTRAALQSQLVNADLSRRGMIQQAQGSAIMGEQNLRGNAANMTADTNNAAAKNTQVIGSKSQELPTAMAQNREKMFGAMIQMMDGINANVLERLKRLCAGFKF